MLMWQNCRVRCCMSGVRPLEPDGEAAATKAMCSSTCLCLSQFVGADAISKWEPHGKCYAFYGWHVRAPSIPFTTASRRGLRLENAEICHGVRVLALYTFDCSLRELFVIIFGTAFELCCGSVHGRSLGEVFCKRQKPPEPRIWSA